MTSMSSHRLQDGGTYMARECCEVHFVMPVLHTATLQVRLTRLRPVRFSYLNRAQMLYRELLG